MVYPEKVRIPYEDFEGARFQNIGRADDGTQFMAFVTGAFIGKDRYPSSQVDLESIETWNAVIHRFDPDGNHIGSEAKRGGYGLDRDAPGEEAWEHLQSMWNELGIENPHFCDIYIKLFSVEIDDVDYALEYTCEVDEYDGKEYEDVMLWPQDLMFHEPWDSGSYSS
jgi:hypothetical protein